MSPGAHRGGRGDRHAIKPTSVRLPADLRTLADEVAAVSGSPLRPLLVDAIRRGLAVIVAELDEQPPGPADAAAG